MNVLHIVLFLTIYSNIEQSSQSTWRPKSSTVLRARRKQVLNVRCRPSYIYETRPVSATRYATLGDSVEIPCLFNATEWLVLRPWATYFIPFTTYNASYVMLTNINREDAGIYYCAKDKMEYSVRLVVNGAQTTTVQWITIYTLCMFCYILKK